MIDSYISELRSTKLLAKHAAKIIAFVRPTIRITPRKAKAADDKVGASRFGGEPDLPAGTTWPMGGGWDGDDVPMEFIAQIDLATIARHDETGLLPKTGLLAFFLSANYKGCRVLHTKPGALVRMRNPAWPKKHKAKAAGLELGAERVLPPPWSHFVSSKSRSASAWNARTNVTGKGTTAIELTKEAHEAYVDIYTRWNTASGWPQTGMLGYERMLEDVQRTDEHVLLRLDYDEKVPYDFVEVVSIYWLITKRALAAKAFDKTDVFCGSTI